ncbi:MAG: tetraacyldisaccharide 4'-kinase [Candidatus Omnitrophota bacterium]
MKKYLTAVRHVLYNLATDKTIGVLASIVKFCLLILSFIYRIIIRLVMFLSCRKQYQSKCKVISVGNITLGGTGKTPLVEFIARYLKEHGHKPAILSRGYKRRRTKDEGRRTREEGRGMRDEGSYEVMGDEPYMLQKNLVDIPVLVGSNRIKSMESSSVVDLGVDIFILDDGFQQWGIKKDLEIVTIDAINPFGNRHMLPRGILRQPLSTLKKADIFVLTKTDISPDVEIVKKSLAYINPRAVIVETVHEPAGLYPLNRRNDLLDMNAFVHENISLVSGIADHGYFLKTVQKLGINPSLVFNFPDHYDYSLDDIEDIVKKSQDKGINFIIITEKDAVKFCRLPITGLSADQRILVLQIKLKIIKNEQEFNSRLL